MKDFEQLYYDSLYKNRKLEEEIKNLKQELEIYKNKKDAKSIIMNDFSKYMKKKNNQNSFKKKLLETINKQNCHEGNI